MTKEKAAETAKTKPAETSRVGVQEIENNPVLRLRISREAVILGEHRLHTSSSGRLVRLLRSKKVQSS